MSNNISKPIKIGVVIGRMNPPHKGHLSLIQQAVEENNYVIVVLGSAKQVPDPKNPLSAEQRTQLLFKLCNDCGVSTNSILVTSVKDFLYSDVEWVNAVKQQVIHNANTTLSYISTNTRWSGTLYGYEKDDTSKYLKWFKDIWAYQPIAVPFTDDHEKIVSSTAIRDILFSKGLFALQDPLIVKACSPKQIEYLEQWILSSEFHAIQQDYEHYKEYKQRWNTSPFPPVFVTGDAVVFCNGHVLVVTRKGPPGCDTYALPGGFIDQEETIKECIIRELREETKIDVPPGKLKNCLRSITVFDAPQRSLRGRTITHAGLIVLDEPTLPRVKGADDARSAFWLSLHHLDKFQDKFFEDHWHIINVLKTI